MTELNLFSTPSVIRTPSTELEEIYFGFDRVINRNLNKVRSRRQVRSTSEDGRGTPSNAHVEHIEVDMRKSTGIGMYGLGRRLASRLFRS